MYYSRIIVVSFFIFQDINECLDAALNAVDLCAEDPNTQCLNAEGSFQCICVPGFVRENGTCQRKQFNYSF